jgi:hypothetical protein
MPVRDYNEIIERKCAELEKTYMYEFIVTFVTLDAENKTF